MKRKDKEGLAKEAFATWITEVNDIELDLILTAGDEELVGLTYENLPPLGSLIDKKIKDQINDSYK